MHRSPKERPSQGHLSPGEHFFPLNWTFTRHEEFSKIVFKPMYSFKCVRKSLSPLQLLTFFSCAWFSALMDLPKCHWATKWFCEIASPPASCGFVLILHSSSEWADENKERGLLVTNCVLLVCLDKTQNIRNSSNVLTMCYIQSTNFDLQLAQAVQIHYLKINQAASLRNFSPNMSYWFWFCITTVSSS